MSKKAIITIFISISCLILYSAKSSYAMDDYDDGNTESIEERLFSVEKMLKELSTTTDDLSSTSHDFKDYMETSKVEWPKWLKVGMGLRTSFSSVEQAADAGDDWNQDFALENMRLYVSANLTDKIGLVFNTERFDDPDPLSGAASDIRVIDAYGTFAFHDLFNVWVGRFLPPSDRFNLDGPYYLNSWDFPFVQAYPAIFAGRLEGISFWGQKQFGKVHVKYQLGAFDEFASTRPGGPNEDDDLIYTGRITFNFWEPEPGYYNNSTYYGEKDVLALAFVGFFQNDGVGSSEKQGDFTAWNIDFLMEKKLSNGGVVNLEAAYFNYDLDGESEAEAASGGALVDGHSWLAVASYMFPQKIGWGYVQPIARYMSFDREHLGLGTRERWEIGATYVMKGHDAKVNFFYGNEHPGSGGVDERNDNFSMFKIGVQLQR